jgi:hypothetical protein
MKALSSSENRVQNKIVVRETAYKTWKYSHFHGNFFTRFQVHVMVPTVVAWYADVSDKVTVSILNFM